jgi:hypothetical protein
MSGFVIHIGNDAEAIHEATQRATGSNLHLITDGQRVVLSPVILPGWFPVPIPTADVPLTETIHPKEASCSHPHPLAA